MASQSDTGSVHALDQPRKRSAAEFFRELFHSFSDDDILGRSAQLAYYFFFAIFPGFIFVSAIASIFSRGSGFRESLLHHMATMLPPDAFKIIQNSFTTMGHNTGRLTFGIIVALWSATAGMSAACDTLNAVHDIKEGRPYWKVQLTAIGLTIVTTILVLCGIGVFFVGDTLTSFAGNGGFSGVERILIDIAQYAVALFLVAMVFAITYYYAPDMKRRHWHWITPGAAVGIALWVIASAGLRIYLHYFNSYSASYGSVGAVMILLLWFYIAGLALLFGAEINTVRESQAAHEGNPEAAAKGQKTPPRAA